MGLCPSSWGQEREQVAAAPSIKGFGVIVSVTPIKYLSKDSLRLGASPFRMTKGHG